MAKTRLIVEEVNVWLGDGLSIKKTEDFVYFFQLRLQLGREKSMEIQQTNEGFFVEGIDLEEFLDKLPTEEQEKMNECTGEIVDILCKYPNKVAFFSLFFLFAQALPKAAHEEKPENS
jgi:hypothetical protein